MKDNLYTTKCPFCNSEAWIQTNDSIGDINSIRMICTNVYCQAIIQTEYDPKLSGLAYMGLLNKIEELRENPDERKKIIKYQFCPNCGQALDWSDKNDN